MNKKIIKYENLIEQCAVIQDDALYMYCFVLSKESSLIICKSPFISKSDNSLYLNEKATTSLEYCVCSQEKENVFMLDGQSDHGIFFNETKQV